MLQEYISVTNSHLPTQQPTSTKGWCFPRLIQADQVIMDDYHIHNSLYPARDASIDR